MTEASQPQLQPRRRTTWSRDAAWIVLLLGAFSFAYRELMTHDFTAAAPADLEATDRAFFAPTGNSPALMFAVAAMFLYSRLLRLQDSFGSPARPALAAGLVLSAALLFLWSSYVGAPDLLIVSLAGMIVATGAALGGVPGLRSVLFPALFLVFAFPVPALIINTLVYPLQLLSADVAVWILGLVGDAPRHVGDLIYYDNHAFQVIETCSGFRTIVTLTMAAVLYGEVFHCGGRRAVALVVCAPFIGFVVNSARVLTIIVTPTSTFGSDHTLQGIAMLVLGVLTIAQLDRVLKRTSLFAGSNWSGTWARSKVMGEGWGDAKIRVACMLVLLGGLGLAGSLMPRWEPGGEKLARLYRVPAKLRPDTLVKGLAMDVQFLGSVGYSDSLFRRYSPRVAKGEAEKPYVELMILSDNRLVRSSSLLSQKVAVPGMGWGLESQEQVDLEGRVVTAQTYRFIDGARMRVYSWFEGVETYRGELLRSLLGLDRSPFRRPGRALALRMSTPIWIGPNAEAEAEARLHEFGSALRQGLDKVGISPTT